MLVPVEQKPIEFSDFWQYYVYLSWIDKPLYLKKLAEIPDSALLKLLKENNNLAFDELYNRYWQRLYGYSIKILGDKEISKDTVQDVFIDFWQRRLDVEIENLNAYFYRAVRNQVSKNIRKMNFTSHHLEALEEEVSTFKSEGPVELEELQLSLNSAINALPERCREIFYLSRYKDYTHKEIAKKLGLAVATVDTQISRALKHLRIYLNDTTILLLVLGPIGL